MLESLDPFGRLTTLDHAAGNLNSNASVYEKSHLLAFIASRSIIELKQLPIDHLHQEIDHVQAHLQTLGEYPGFSALLTGFISGFSIHLQLGGISMHETPPIAENIHSSDEIPTMEYLYANTKHKAPQIVFY